MRTTFARVGIYNAFGIDLKITLQNYKELLPYYNLTKSTEPLSPLTYAMWDYFGYHMHYEIIDETAAMIWGFVDEVDRAMFAMPYCPPERNNEVLRMQRSLLEEKTGQKCDTILLYGAFAHINELTKTGFGVRTNYLYDLRKMSTLEGAALQKKRNNYNSFFRNYGFRTKVEKLTVEFIREHKAAIVAFLDQSVEDEMGERRFLIDFLELFGTDDFSGIVLYLDERIIGLTIGHRHGDFYEVYVEKCDRSIRGSYQYLMVTNLQMNDIDAKYMDRQDDASVEGLRLSKESYKPLKMIERVEMKWIT